MHIFFYCVICIVLVNASVLCRRNVNEAIKSRVKLTSLYFASSIIKIARISTKKE